MKNNCPTCGARVKIVGDLTKHYQPEETMDKNYANQVYDRINDAIDYVTTEYKLDLHEIVGILEHIKYDLMEGENE